MIPLARSVGIYWAPAELMILIVKSRKTIFMENNKNTKNYNLKVFSCVDFCVCQCNVIESWNYIQEVVLFTLFE